MKMGNVKEELVKAGMHRNGQDACIRVHYPAGRHVFTLVAENAPHTPLPPLANATDDTWEVTVKDLTEPLSFRPMRDGKAAKGAPYQVQPGQTLDVYPWFDRDSGTPARFDDAFHSRILGNVRGIRMYTPPSYPENTLKRYPVIYMHDGQVLFDADIAPEDGPPKRAYGSWKIEKVMDAEIAAGRIPEAIVIGVDVVLDLNAPEPTLQRTRELTPTQNDAYFGGSGTGQGPLYLRMLIEELRPAVNEKLRTLADRAHTFLIGSSLGGLISVWAGLEHGETFGAIASLSTSSHWDEEVLVARVRSLRIGPTTTRRIYLDIGQGEGAASERMTVAHQERLEAALVGMGYVKGQTLMTVVDPIGKHYGESWNRRVPVVLAFLLGGHGA